MRKNTQKRLRLILLIPSEFAATQLIPSPSDRVKAWKSLLIEEKNAKHRGSPVEIRLFGFSPEGGTSSAGGDNHRSGHSPSAKPGGLAHPSGE
jgi:hypothetical protein